MVRSPEAATMSPMAKVTGRGCAAPRNPGSSAGHATEDGPDTANTAHNFLAEKYSTVTSCNNWRPGDSA